MGKAAARKYIKKFAAAEFGKKIERIGVEIQNVVKKWFNVDLKDPQYERGVDTQIILRI
ncbi:MAG UNVERIFIED_CONTAM: hypothetical protein LVR29_09030 [Microcystis novacekii LVE1205-3]